jgi:hypothetical protein
MLSVRMVQWGCKVVKKWVRSYYLNDQNLQSMSIKSKDLANLSR